MLPFAAAEVSENLIADHPTSTIRRGRVTLICLNLLSNSGFGEYHQRGVAVNQFRSGVRETRLEIASRKWALLPGRKVP